MKSKSILRLISFVLVAVMALPLFSCGDSADDGLPNYAQIEFEDGNVVIIELRPDCAPITVANFKKLVSSGFYDGLIFHRIIGNFMMQGGDPSGNGTGGSDEQITGEFLKNGISNPLCHDLGVVSMARATAFDSASSQFFICNATREESLNVRALDGSYAAFGVVVSGLEYVVAYADVATDANDKPLTPIVMTKVTLIDYNK